MELVNYGKHALIISLTLPSIEGLRKLEDKEETQTEEPEGEEDDDAGPRVVPNNRRCVIERRWIMSFSVRNTDWVMV